MQITAHASDNSLQLIEPGERSEPSQKVSNASVRVGSVGVTRCSQTTRATVRFETKIEIEPDIETPKTIMELANEQRAFLNTLPDDFVDIDLPLEN